jgi:ribokinase
MTGDRKPIVVVGSINMDLVASAEYIPSVGETIEGTGFQFQPGGKGANQAVAVAKLGYPVRMIGKVGDDLFGIQLRSRLEESGVETAGIGVSPGSSGIALIVVSDRGENIIVVIPGANATVTPEFLEQKRDIICSAGMVLTQLEIPLGTVEYLASMCERENIPLVLDPAPARPLSRALLESISWFTPNETEAAFFAGGATNVDNSSSPHLVAGRLFEKGVKRMVLKLGARGAFLVTGADNQVMLESTPVRAIDTTAAGDAFNGAFATGLLLWNEPLKSARFAMAAAAVSVTRFGAQASMASMKEVQELLERGLDAVQK